jgi:Polysaccharide deacetylase
MAVSGAATPWPRATLADPLKPVCEIREPGVDRGDVDGGFVADDEESDRARGAPAERRFRLCLERFHVLASRGAEARRWSPGLGTATPIYPPAIAEHLPRGAQVITEPSLMSHQSYGPRPPVPKLLAMLERQAMRSTFFVPGFTVECYPKMTRAIVDADHEIGHHGYLNEQMQGIDRDTEARYLDRGLAALERGRGRRPGRVPGPMVGHELAHSPNCSTRGFGPRVCPRTAAPSACRVAVAEPVACGVI